MDVFSPVLGEHLQSLAAGDGLAVPVVRFLAEHLLENLVSSNRKQVAAA